MAMLKKLSLLAFLSLAPLQAWSNPSAATAETLDPLLREELKRLESALGGRMGIALFRTDDPTVQSFIAGGILQVPQDAYLRLESGLAAVAVLEGKHNNDKRPMCYVLFNPHRAGPVVRSSFQPIAQATGDARQGAAYLAAHETAHCLDHLEREGLLAKQMQWTADEAVSVGLQPDAFRRVFGAKAATASYKPRRTELYGDLAQRQYEERVADAFGVLWVWRMGGSEEVRRIVHEIRARDRPKNAHYTAPILEAIPGVKDQLASSQSIDDVWSLARTLQRQTGVDPLLGPNSTEFRNPIAEAVREAKKDNRPAPVQQQVRPKSWNELPRFGAPRNSL